MKAKKQVLSFAARHNDFIVQNMANCLFYICLLQICFLDAISKAKLKNNNKNTIFKMFT